MPGVMHADNTFDDDVAHGPAYFEIDVDVADTVTADQVAAVAKVYLDDLQAQDYRGYAAALDVRRGESVFAVNAGTQPVANPDQVLAQARSWVALQQQFTGSTAGLRAAIDTTQSAVTLQLPDNADYAAVAAAFPKLASAFGDLAAGDVTVSAGRQHPGEIQTSRRLPSPQEIDLWNALNADQSIPHADVFTINGAGTAPLWVSERIAADDVAAALRLAQQHLPIVAAQPVRPIVYTAGNQFRGHIGFHHEATAPVMVTIGGCTARKYRPSPGEQALIDRYENCRR